METAASPIEKKFRIPKVNFKSKKVMANMTVNSYLHQLKDAWDEYDGDRLGELMSLSNAHVQSPHLVFDDSADVDSLSRHICSVLESPLSEMVELHLRTLSSVMKKDFEEALKTQTQLTQTFSKMLATLKDENWAIGMMNALAEDLRKVAISAKEGDYQLIAAIEEGTPTRVEKAAEIIMGLFRVCAADTRTSEENTKRWGMMCLVNHLFKIYFHINRLSLCKPLIRAIEALPFKEKFPREQLVTYKYFVGRKAMFDSEFTNSAECLSYAFRNSNSKENRRKILIYLIPVKMFLGWLPSEATLRKYDVVEFLEIAEAFKVGHLERFRAAMKVSEKQFIKHGIYLILEKLQMTIFRNLIKKVVLISGKTQTPMGLILAALHFVGYTEADLDETHCIVANLIYDGHIRGYISHQHQVLVVAKQNAFPKMSVSSD